MSMVAAKVASISLLHHCVSSFHDTFRSSFCRHALEVVVLSPPAAELPAAALSWVAATAPADMAHSMAEGVHTSKSFWTRMCSTIRASCNTMVRQWQ